MRIKSRTKGAFGPLGWRQAAILTYLWVHGPRSAKDLQMGLSRTEDLAYTTVHTELSRLVRKGLIAKSGQNLETKYYAAVSRAEYLEQRVAETVRELVDAHGAAAIHGLADAVAQTEDILLAFQQALRRRSAYIGAASRDCLEP